MDFTLSQRQLAVVNAPPQSKIFLEGPAGCGKTTAGLIRLLSMLNHGIPLNSILLLTPQRSLAEPYLHALEEATASTSAIFTNLTIGGLARRMVDLFWPVIAERSGFHHPDYPPFFLTLETSQYYIAHIVQPLLAEGYFDSVVMDRNRLYSQILDNLNKAAVVGFPYQEIGIRLKSAWVGEKNYLRIFDDIQDCALRFRAYCLQHNLLDFSLQIELFYKQIWPESICRSYLVSQYRHLIMDNIEEDPPITHDLLSEWLAELDSALIIYDQEAGYRRFLGADPQNALKLKLHCDRHFLLSNNYVSEKSLHFLNEIFSAVVDDTTLPKAVPHLPLSSIIEIATPRYYPQMLDWVAEKTSVLIHEIGASPSEITIVTPYLSDALRYALVDRLEKKEIPCRSHRPSRALREEAVTLCLLTFMEIAHPEWGILPTNNDFTIALMHSIEGMDLVRAKLLTDIVYRPRNNGQIDLIPFENIHPESQERITYELGLRYDGIRQWLINHRSAYDQEPDSFIMRIFGEILSLPGYAFHKQTDAGAITANLIESVQKFRWATTSSPIQENYQIGKEYCRLVSEGVLASQYIRSWRDQDDNSVLIAPAHTFLMHNRTVDYQFWLDISSEGWSERINQPLTHPYVLSRAWQAGAVWTDNDEIRTSNEIVKMLVSGLIRRCRKMVFLGMSELGENGFENRGLLLRTMDKTIRQYSNY